MDEDCVQRSIQPYLVGPALANAVGEAMLVVRDPAGNQGATMELPEDTTNLDVKMNLR